MFKVTSTFDTDFGRHGGEIISHKGTLWNIYISFTSFPRFDFIMLCVTFALICWRWNRDGLPKKGKSYFHFWPRAQFCPWPGERPILPGEDPSDGQRRQSEEKRKLMTTFLISHDMFFREDKKANNYLFKFLLCCRWPRRLVRRQPCLNQFSQSQSVW